MTRKKFKKIINKPVTALALAPQWQDTFKFQQWCKYFLDQRNQETWGNATRSALKAYDTTSYFTAAKIGHTNLKKMKEMTGMVSDQLGFGFGDMMKIGLAKVTTGSYDDWEKMMVRQGYFEPEQKGTMIQNNFDFSTLGSSIAQARQERGLQP
jgi:hypothetical protein